MGHSSAGGDGATLKAYSENAAGFSRDWLAQPPPNDVYGLFRRFFLAGGSTADVGCGNGRDAAWLAANGFPVTGFDSSPELLAIARSLYPAVTFRAATLPFLSDVSEAYANVVCETVLMHLPLSEIPAALASLCRILHARGTLYLSWRVAETGDARHGDGRLYSAVTPSLVRGHLPGGSVLHFEDEVSGSSGKRVCRIVFRKQG